MKTMAPDAPTSHTSERCSASTPGAAIRDKDSSAAAVYAITNSRALRNSHLQSLPSSPGSTGRSTTPRRRGRTLPSLFTGCPAFAGHDSRSHSIRVLVLGQKRQRRLQENVGIEQRRPVFDVVEVVLDALLDLLLVVDLTAPAVDLSPAGNARLDAMAGEIAVDSFVEQLCLQFALHRMRAGTDQGEIALEHDIEKLGQLVKAGLADEAADARDTWIVLCDDLGRVRIGLVMIERAELENVDALIVEAEALLAEQYGSGAVELDRKCDERHDGQRDQQRERADHAIEQPFHHEIPVGDRRLENVEGWHLAQIGIGAGTKPQLVGVRRQPDVDWQHPQFFQHLENARFRRNRQCE